MFEKMCCYALALGFVTLSAGCNQGFKSPEDLTKHKRGPQECILACESLGLRMSAFVLFEQTHSGCVCSPLRTDSAGGAEPEAVLDDDGATAVAAGHAVLMERQRQEQQRQATSQQMSASH